MVSNNLCKHFNSTVVELQQVVFVVDHLNCYQQIESGKSFIQIHTLKRLVLNII
jgi:hypothetical protein